MIREEIKKIINQAIGQIQKEKNWPSFKMADLEVERPENKEFGDYSTNIAMILAKIVKKKPIDIAELLVDKLKVINHKFQDIKIAQPGFINFDLSEKYLQKQVKKILKQKDKFGQLKIGLGKKIQVEFISANPTGLLTVGNARGGSFGDVLANILKSAGFEVEKAYYANNYGMQILTLGHSVLKDKKAEYEGKYIDDLHKKIKEKDPYKVGQKAAEIITKEIIKKTTDNLGIKFDNWFYEQTLYDSGKVDEILTLLGGENLIYKKDGASWFRSSKFGDEKDRVIIKSNGWKTYLAGDAAYHQYKFKEKKFDKVINVWGADHHGDVLRLKGVIEALGYKNKLEIILLQLVGIIKEKQKFKMSKRTGNYVTIDELLNEVNADVIRFFFLQKSADTHLNFDISLAKDQSKKNPVYYVQYAYARICSIIGKITKYKLQIISKTQIQNHKLQTLNHPSELNLIKELIKFPEIIEDIAKDYQIQRLPRYSLELAAAFHKFYKNCRVISDDKTITQTRLFLVKATQIVLKNTLNLMGISAPTKM